MGFWLLRGVIALVAITATLVPAGAAAVYGWDVLDARAENAERSDLAHQELMVYHAEILLADNRIQQKPESVQSYHQSNIGLALLEFTSASDDWRHGAYGQMADHIIAGRAILVENQYLGEGETSLEKDRSFTDDAVVANAWRGDITMIAAIAAVVAWTIWGGLSPRLQQSVPMPVFPGEVEISVPQEETEPAPAFPEIDPARRAPEAGRRSADRRPPAREPAALAGTSTPAEAVQSAALPRAGDPGRVTRKVKAKPLPALPEDHDDDPITPS